MSRRTVRDAWLEDVRRSTDIGDACRVLLMTMAAEGMTEKGYTSIPRTKLAELLGRHPQRVTERIGEAIKAGFLVRVGDAYEGKTASYAANFPTSRGNGRAVTSQTPGTPRGNGSAVTSERLPLQDREGLVTGREVTGERLPNTHARARATKNNRQPEPAPDGSRGPELHHPPTSGSDGEPATPVSVASAGPWVPTGEPQAGDGRAHYEARGRALRLAALGGGAS